MKITYLNNSFVVEDLQVLVSPGGEPKYTLSAPDYETLDRALEVLDSAEDAQAALKVLNLPAYVQLSWTALASQLKAVGLSVVEEYGEFEVTRTVYMNNNGKLELDEKRNWFRGVTASGREYYPDTQPSSAVELNHVAQSASFKYVTSFIKFYNEAKS